MRLRNSLLVSLVILSILLQLIHIQTIQQASAEQVYPITVQNKITHDVSNVTVMITLNSTTFSNWSLLQPDGSDVFFTDGQGNPLFYYIENIDVSNKEMLVWVKIPSIQSNGNVTIYMHYGGSNPYRGTYSDPHNVFVYYEDFDSAQNLTSIGWNVVKGNPYVAESYLVLQGPGTNSYTTVNHTLTIPSVGENVLIAVDVKVTPVNPSADMFIVYTYTGSLAYNLTDGSISYGYGVELNSGNGDSLVKYNGTNGVVIYDSTSSKVTNTSHVVTYALMSGNVVDTSTGQLKSGYYYFYYVDYIETLTSSSIAENSVLPTPTSLALGAWGNSTYKIDWIRVRTTPLTYTVYAGVGAQYNGTLVDDTTNSTNNSTTTNTTTTTSNTTNSSSTTTSNTTTTTSNTTTTTSDNVNNSTTSDNTTTTTNTTTTDYYNTTSTVTSRTYILTVREKIILLLAGFFLLLLLLLASRV